jgi:hypothetical protein
MVTIFNDKLQALRSGDKLAVAAIVDGPKLKKGRQQTKIGGTLAYYHVTYDGGKLRPAVESRGLAGNLLEHLKFAHHEQEVCSILFSLYSLLSPFRAIRSGFKTPHSNVVSQASSICILNIR